MHYKNEVFVFIGEPMTGKSDLARHLKKEECKVIDDFTCERERCKSLIVEMIRDDRNYVIITNNEECKHELLDRLKGLDYKYNISVVRFSQL